MSRTTRFIVNREGERGDEVPRSREGLYRVLVAGGSQPEGYFLDQDTTWPGALHRLLETPAALSRLGASKVHVGCVARSGVGSEGLDLIFSRLLPQYPRLQLIIILVGVTDVMRWIEQGTPDALAPVTVGDVFRCHPDGPFGWTPRRLAMTELALRGRRRFLRPIDVDHDAGGWMGRARTMRANAPMVLDSIRDPRPMLDHFDRHFRRLLSRAKAHADRVIVIRQPWFNRKYSAEEATLMWHGGVGHAWREQVRTYYAFETFDGVMRALDARAAAVASASDVDQLDLMPVLEQSARTYYDAFHLTDAGARQVAEAVMASIFGDRLPCWRMTERGSTVEVEEPTAAEQAALKAS